MAPTQMANLLMLAQALVNGEKGSTGLSSQMKTMLGAMKDTPEQSSTTMSTMVPMEVAAHRLDSGQPQGRPELPIPTPSRWTCSPLSAKAAKPEDSATSPLRHQHCTTVSRSNNSTFRNSRSLKDSHQHIRGGALVISATPVSSTKGNKLGTVMLFA
ncbi:uncharacterized protein RHO25_013194 [Cercospora beticola]|uniref:Uncharacterized protein n=1 Tax=Cercospora beticola TaxID=122368 RepID=A0ABZ0P9E1_CERBT|nr:hypothetical protein RHO25_013194 [Cercospora beticola]